MTVTDNHIQMRPDAPTLEWLTCRAERMHETTSMQAKAELALWRSVLDAELRRIRLTVAQASCVADVMAGSQLQAVIAVSVGTVYAACYDAFRLARSGPTGDVSSYGAKHGVDEQPLLDYLGSLGPAADHALADAISRWWERDLDATAEGFAAAGLKVSD